MSKNSNLTKQGVRDLNNIGPRRPKSKRLELPPDEAFMDPGTVQSSEDRDYDYSFNEFKENRRGFRR